MSAPARTDTSHPRLSHLRLWFGVATPAIVWGGQLLLMYFFFSVFRDQGDGFVRAALSVLSALAAVLVVLALLAALDSRRAVSEPERSVARTESRQAFMATTGAVGAVLFLFGVILLFLPVFMLDVTP